MRKPQWFTWILAGGAVLVLLLGVAMVLRARVTIGDSRGGRTLTFLNGGSVDLIRSETELNSRAFRERLIASVRAHDARAADAMMHDPPRFRVWAGGSDLNVNYDVPLYSIRRFEVHNLTRHHGERNAMTDALNAEIERLLIRLIEEQLAVRTAG